jgi:elongation of very long chain fatty acids protein 4
MCKSTTQISAAMPSSKDPIHSVGTTTPSSVCEKVVAPSMTARYACASILVAIFSVWGKFAYMEDETKVPGGKLPLHSFAVPLGCVAFYLVSLPLLRMATERFLSGIDVKLLLRESMILYNAAQVLLNGWMVYKFVQALLFRGHPFVGGHYSIVETGATYAVWVHYLDKYLEFLDTYFMILRGRMDQVSTTYLYDTSTLPFCL